MKKVFRRTLRGYLLLYFSVFLIALMILIPIYRIAYNASRDNIERNLKEVMQENFTRFTDQMKSVRQYVYNLMKQEEITFLTYLEDENHFHLVQARKLQQILIDSLYNGASLASNFVVFFDNNDYVIAKTFILRRSNYWSKENGFFIDGYTQCEFEKALFEDRQTFFGNCVAANTTYIAQGNAIVIGYLSNTSTKVYYAVCAIITNEAIEKIIMEPTLRDYGAIRIADMKGNVLFDKCAQGLGSVTSWRFTSEDRQYIMDVSVDKQVFAESVREVRITIIVCCAMAFFVFAILMAATVRRLYAPINEYLRFIDGQDWRDSEEDVKSLNECIRESMRHFSVNSDLLKENLSQLKKQYRASTLLNLISGIHIQREHLCKCFGEDMIFEGDYILVLLHFDGDLVALDDVEMAHRMATERFEADFQSLYAASSLFIAVLKVDGKTEEETNDKLEQMGARIAAAMRHPQTVVYLVRSNIHHGLDGLKTAYEEAGCVVRNIGPFLREGRHLLRYGDCAPLTDIPSLMPFEVNSLYNLLFSGDHDGIQCYMQKLRKQMEEIVIHYPNRMPALYYSVLSVLETVLARMNKRLPLQDFDAAWTLDDTYAYLNGAAHEIGRLSAEREKADVKDEVLTYLQENFNSAEMCLTHLSKKFDFSEAYISRLIKAKTGMGYSEYLEALRMKRATELLEYSDMRVADISATLGYETPNTFFKAFKRVYHVSPGVYRGEKERVE